MSRSASTLVVFLLFFFSGSCGLIYQVVWSRMMTHVFGATVFAISTVLAAFMAGLALGSYVLGKRGDQARNPLRWFAWYEFGIGLTALLVVLLLDRLGPVYVWLSQTLGHSFALLTLARFVIAFTLLIIPTTLMGATLPVLSRYTINRFDRAGHTLGALYGINTLGAVLGCLLAGFVLIGNLGIYNTVYLAVLLNLTIGTCAWLVSRKAPSKVDTDGQEPAQPVVALNDPHPGHEPYQRRLSRLLLWGFAVSGFTAFAYEIFWTRSLIFFVGNSTYAFATMLSAFLVGIALGSFVARLLIDRLKHPVRFFAWVQIGIGASAAAAIPLLTWLLHTEFFLSLLVNDDQLMRGGFTTRLLLCFVVMLLPTLLIGMTFPLVGRIILKDLNQTSTDIGRVYAINTLGNIAGALLPGFLILPLVGIHKGIWLMALINVAIGAVLLAHGKTRLHPWRLVFPAGVVCVFVLLWLTPMHHQFPAQGQTSEDEVLYYREGPMATTMVFADALTGRKSMTVDGIEIGGTNRGVDYKQQWLAHLPKLLLADYESELSVGFGSGILAGESALHDALKQITCIEIAPSVVQGAAAFTNENHGILDSSRATFVVNDAVNYLQATRKHFDIISTDGKTHPEYSVNGTFFSQEYYTLMRDRLATDGMAIQWIAIHYPPRIFRIALKTFSDVFPHVMLWHANGNCFLVGSNHEISPDLEMIRSRLTGERGAFAGLNKRGITTPANMVAHLVAREDVMREALTDTRINTRMRPIIEFYKFDDFAIPIEQRELENLALILEMRGKGAVADWVESLPNEVAEVYYAEDTYLLGKQAMLQGKGPEVFADHFDRALALTSDQDSIRYQIFGHLFNTAQHVISQGDATAAEPYLRQAVQVWPNDAEARELYGRILMDQNKTVDALKQFEAAVQLEPRRIPNRHILAKLYLAFGRVDLTIEQLRSILEIDADDLIALYSLGYLLGEQGAFEQALPLLEKAYRIEPNNPRAIHCYAWITYLSGDQKRARQIVEKGGYYYKDSEEMTQVRSKILE